MSATAINWMDTARPVRARNVTTAQETDTKTSYHVSGVAFSHSSAHIDFFCRNFWYFIVSAVCFLSVSLSVCVSVCLGYIQE